jgi:hypothetical protein
MNSLRVLLRTFGGLLLISLCGVAGPVIWATDQPDAGGDDLSQWNWSSGDGAGYSFFQSGFPTGSADLFAAPAGAGSEVHDVRLTLDGEFGEASREAFSQAASEAPWGMLLVFSGCMLAGLALLAYFGSIHRDSST